MNPLDFRFEPGQHKYFLGNVELPSITTVLKATGFYTEFSYDPAALRRGTWIHSFCQYHNENDLDWNQVPDEMMGYVLAWEKMKRETGYTPLTWEVMRYHSVFMFAGRYDNDGIFPDGSKAIMEIKTGHIAPATAIQTAAQETLLGQARKRMAVELHEDGTYKLELFKDHQDANLFMSALALYNWRKKSGLIK